MGKSEKYGKALDELDAMHRSGKISDARYEMHKTRLLAESANPPANPVWRFVSGIGVGLVVLLLLAVVLKILNG